MKERQQEIVVDGWVASSVHQLCNERLLAAAPPGDWYSNDT